MESEDTPNWTRNIPKCFLAGETFFFLTGIHFMQESAATTRHGFTRKRSTNTLNYTGNLLRKNLQLNSRLKATKIIGQRKPFYRHKIPECSCARKETVEIDILVTSRSGDRKTIQPIRITSRPVSRIKKWKLFSQLGWTPTKVILRKDVSWLHFDDEAMVQERQQVNDQQSYLSVFITYPTISSSNEENQARHDSSIPYMSVW